MSINHRMILFAHHYLNEAKFDPVKAAEMAGYANPHKVCGQLLANATIKAYLLKKAEEAGVMSAEEVLARWTTIASFDPTEFLEFTTEENRAGNEVERVSFDIKKLKRKGLGYLIKKLKIQPSGQVEVEFHDGVEASDKIAKFRGMFKERIEVTHVGDGRNDRIIAILGGLAQLAGTARTGEVYGEAEPRALCSGGERGEVDAGPASEADQPVIDVGGREEDHSTSFDPRPKAREIGDRLEILPGLDVGEEAGPQDDRGVL
jgi:hypothetical protein